MKKIKTNYWLIAVAVAALVLGGGLVVFSSPSLSVQSIFSALKVKLSGNPASEDNETQAGTTVEVEEKEVADERPESVVGGKGKIDSSTYVSPPVNQTPWGQGASEQGGSEQQKQTPWQQGPSISTN